MQICAAVIGAGSWGTTVAHLLAHNTSTVLWARDPVVADEISESHTNSRYLEGYHLHPNLRATASFPDAVRQADLLVMGVPSHGFRSTLEEVAEADLLLHVVDGAHEDPEGQLAAVRDVLRDIDATAVPEIVVINKADAADPMVLARLLRNEPHSVVVSALTGQGIEELLAAIERDLPRPRIEVRALVPYSQGALVARAHRDGVVLSAEHTGEGTLLHALVGSMLAAELEVFAAPDPEVSAAR